MNRKLRSYVNLLASALLFGLTPAAAQYFAGQREVVPLALAFGIGFLTSIVEKTRQNDAADSIAETVKSTFSGTGDGTIKKE